MSQEIAGIRIVEDPSLEPNQWILTNQQMLDKDDLDILLMRFAKNLRLAINDAKKLRAHGRALMPQHLQYVIDMIDLQLVYLDEALKKES